MAKARSLPFLDAHIPNRENARLVIQARLAELYTWDAYVERPDCIKELHNLRIAAKRLRYSLEVFEDVLPPESTALREEAEKIQEELGALHDNDVLSALLRLCLEPGNNTNHDGATVLQEMRQKKLDQPLSLLNHLLDPETLPTPEERRGLELLLNEVTREREEQYQAFRQHWHELKEHDYRQSVLALLDQGTQSQIPAEIRDAS